MAEVSGPPPERSHGLDHAGARGHQSQVVVARRRPHVTLVWVCMGRGMTNAVLGSVRFILGLEALMSPILGLNRFGSVFGSNCGF